jgi:hypothetical protein
MSKSPRRDVLCLMNGTGRTYDGAHPVLNLRFGSAARSAAPIREYARLATFCEALGAPHVQECAAPGNAHERQRGNRASWFDIAALRMASDEL